MPTSESKPIVVLLHGLARSSRAMNKMASFLDGEGYEVINIDYPSTEHPIETLIDDHVLPLIKQHLDERVQPLNFVTHSMGGILVRQMASLDSETRGFEFGRVVMLSPPNKGSEVVDKLGGWWLFNKINGPAGMQLGTGEDSKPNALGQPAFELGVITGDRSINLILSLMIPGDDDGKVSTASAQIEGMKDFRIMHATHTFIMRKQVVMDEVLQFLQNGSFTPE